MIQTLVVYFIIYITIYWGTQKASISKKNLNLILALLPYSIFMGWRYGVGADFFMYHDTYNEMLNGKYWGRNYEAGYLFLMELFTSLKLPVEIFFMTLAFTQVYLVFKSIKNDTIKILPSLSIVFVLSCTWLAFNNGIRQELAFCILCFSLKYVIEKRITKFLLCIIIASLIHKSALLTLIVYPLFYKRNAFINNTKTEIFLYISSLVLMLLNVVNYIVNTFDFLITMSGYSIYLTDDRYSDILSKNEMKSFGIGSYVIFLINFVNILYGKKAKDFFKSNFLNITYDLYYIGALWFCIFMNSQLFSRLNYYMYGFNFIVGAYVLHYLSKKHTFVHKLLFSLYILLFIGYMYKMNENTTLYIFSWQTDLFYLKKFMHN